MTKINAAKFIIDMLKDAKKFRTPIGTFISIKQGVKEENLDLESETFKDYLRSEFAKQNGFRFPSEKSLKDAISFLKNEAKKAPLETMEYRILSIGKEVLYDLSDDLGQYVKITPSGWSVMQGSPEHFIQGPDERPQTMPSKCGNIDLLKKYVNIAERDWFLFAAYLVSCFLPNIQHPILNINGANGSGKSTLVKLVKSLVDPSDSDLENFELNSISDLSARLSSAYYVAFDNLSKLTKRESDFLCKVVTGASFSKRALYSNNNVFTVKIKKPISINGIVDVVESPDLAQRCVFFQTVAIDDNARKVDERFWQEFDQDKPIILAGVFEILSNAMKLHEKCKVTNLQRMADFHKWGFEICEAMGGYGNKFLESAKLNEIRQTLAARENNILVELIMDLVDNEGQWSGMVSSLYRYLRDMMEADLEKYELSNDYPQNSAVFGKKLRIIQSVLYTNKVKLNLYSDNNNFSCVDISNIEDVKQKQIEIVREPIFLSKYSCG